MLPENWSLVPIQGRYVLRDGTPATGYITFESRQVVMVDGVQVVPKTLVAHLTKDGEIPAGFTLPSTDDPALSVGGWAYKVTESWQGGRNPFSIFVPHNAALIDLPDAAPVVPPPELADTRGPRGYAGTMAVESVETVEAGIPASVENVGDASDARLVFRIPKGDTGDVTPEAIAARDAAQEAASDAADSANLAEQARLLGATIGFATKADMDASLAHPAQTLALVTNDPTPANNGTYRKTGAIGAGGWAVSADRVTGLEGRVGSAESTLAAQEETLDRVGAFRDNARADIEVLVDEVGSVVRRTDANGEVSVPGIPGSRSIQHALRNLNESASLGSAVRPRDLIVVADDAGRVILRMDGRGGFYVPGMTQPLQAAAGNTLSATKFPRTAREKLHPVIKSMVSDLLNEQQPFVPPPTLLVPNGYQVPDGFISAFDVDENEGVMLETPYGPGGLVHPYLLEMRRPAWGYRFLMMETPHKYGNSREENPILYGSNDLVNFDLIPDVSQPLGFPPPGQSNYMQDVGFSYDPRNGELFIYWTSLTDGDGSLHYRSTFDAVSFGPERVVPDGSKGGVSPAILYDPIAETWRMWNTWNGVLNHYTGPSIAGPWALAGSQNFSVIHGIDLWHLEVKWLGERFFILANQRNSGSNLWLGYSDDGTNWTMGPALINPPAANIYKGTFIPEFDGDRARIHLGWNTYAFPLPDGIRDAFHLVKSDWVNLTSL